MSENFRDHTPHHHLHHQHHQHHQHHHHHGHQQHGGGGGGDSQQKAGGDSSAGGGGEQGGGLFHGLFDAMKQASESLMKGQPPDFGQMAQSLEQGLQQDIYGGKK